MSGAIDPVISTSATKNTCWYGAPSKGIPLSSRTVPALSPQHGAVGAFAEGARLIGDAQVRIDLEGAGLHAQRPRLARRTGVPVDDPYAHATPGELVREHQPGGAGSDDEDIRIHMQGSFPTPWPPARASRRNARWSATARGHRRIQPPRGAMCGSDETGGSRGTPRPRRADRPRRARSGARPAAGAGLAPRRDRRDPVSGGATATPRVAGRRARGRAAAARRAGR